MTNLASTILVQAAPAGQGSLLVGLLPIVFIFVIFYLMLILPQQRRQKRWREMLENLKSGDRVITSGGIRGTVVALREDHLHLKVPPDNLRIEVARSAVVGLASPEEGK